MKFYFRAESDCHQDNSRKGSSSKIENMPITC